MKITKMCSKRVHIQNFFCREEIFTALLKKITGIEMMNDNQDRRFKSSLNVFNSNLLTKKFNKHIINILSWSFSCPKCTQADHAFCCAKSPPPPQGPILRPEKPWYLLHTVSTVIISTVPDRDQYFSRQHENKPTSSWARLLLGLRPPAVYEWCKAIILMPLSTKEHSMEVNGGDMQCNVR